MNARISQVKPHLEFAELERRYKAAKRPSEQRYWTIIRMMAIDLEHPYGQGPSCGSQPLSILQIAIYTGYSVKQVRRIVHAYNDKGPDDFLPMRRRPPSTGRRRLLSAEQEGKLYLVLASGRTAQGQKWTCKRVQGWIRKEFNIHVDLSTASRYSRRCKSQPQSSLFF